MRLWGNSRKFHEFQGMDYDVQYFAPSRFGDKKKIVVKASCPWTRHLCVTFCLQSFENFTYMEEIPKNHLGCIPNPIMGINMNKLPTSTGFMKGLSRAWQYQLYQTSRKMSLNCFGSLEMWGENSEIVTSSDTAAFAVFVGIMWPEN